MKVIDLLNKIANGEEVPKKVFYKTGAEYTGGYYWNYDESFRDYIDKAGDYVFNAGNYHVIDMLNMEVEVIEDKKIEKLKGYISCGFYGTCKDLRREVLFEDLQGIGNKINEIIDHINKE